jgi:VWFA-related protein
MTRTAVLLLFAFAGGVSLAAADGDVVFHSDVSLVRVDAQVLDRDNRAVSGLHVEDFVLREEGQPQQIRNFASEEMPVDVMLLLDVSRSMRPHIQRVSSAAHQAFQVLRAQDRVAIMVFDRSTRLRLPFRNGRDEAERELTALLRHEAFDGGTDITRGMLDAADYVARQARREARRAIVIVTDDRTQGERDEAAVSRALTRADAVLCALIAPDAMRDRSGWPGGGGRGGGRGGGGGGGGSWPGGGGPTIGGPLGGIILGRRGSSGGGGGRGGPGQGAGGSPTHSAGTAEIARDSGGDSVAVDDASALENTLSRIRQRYALHFHLPDGVKPGQERNIEVELAAAARQRYPGVEVRYRRVYLTPDARGPAEASSPPAQIRQGATARRRPAVNEPLGGPGATSTVDTTPSPATPAPPPAADPAPAQGGWPRVKPGEQP